MQCNNCNQTNPNQARFCLNCGHLLVQGTICTTCDTLLPNDSKYCFHCGAVVISTITLTQPNTTSNNNPAPQPINLPPSPSPDQNNVLSHPQIAETSTIGTLPEARPIKSMLQSLAVYLPKNLYDPLERKPNQKQIDSVKVHLELLLETTKTYLPKPVIESPQPTGVPNGGIINGVFLFGDVSGFTPLSEQLKKLGQEGAEKIAEIINDLFFDLVTILFAHGGTLLKFGGDALLGVFSYSNDEEKLVSARYAAQASLAMQNQMKKYSKIEAAGEVRALAIKCGISTGPYFAAHIGTKPKPEKGQKGIMSYVTTGHTVNRAEQAEGYANPGDVVMDQETQSILDGIVEVKQLEDDYYKLINISPSDDTLSRFEIQEPPEGDIEQQITYLVDRLDRLSPYLSPELISRIANNPKDPKLTPDHRPVTVMFANYLGISDLIEDLGETDPDMIIKHLNDYFTHMAEVVEHYEGTLARMDQYAVGDRLVIFFGAPRAHEDDPERAVYTALEMQKAVKDNFSALQTPTGIYRFRQRIGLNTGHLFAGNAGAPDLRQEYTLMGDDINMAARLMSNSDWQEIFISKKTYERVEPYFELKDRGELKVKGKEILIPTFEVIGKKDEIGKTRGLGSINTPLIGREDEQSKLIQIFEDLRGGRGQILSVIGESGLGKTRIIQDFKESLTNKENKNNIQWLRGNALSFSEQISYWLAAQIISGTFKVSEESSEDDKLFSLWEKGEELLGKETARETMPFLAHVMGLELKDDWAEIVFDLDPKVRQKQIFWSVTEYLKAYAIQTPTIIILDDLHFADEASLALIENLFDATLHAPILFALSYRPRRDKGCWQLKGIAEKSYHHRYSEITLDVLSEKNSNNVITALLPGANIPKKILNEIFMKTSGNPFYIEEVVRTLMDSGAVEKDSKDQSLWNLTEKASSITVPDSLQGAIVARIDRLTEESKTALQMASVIGRKFQIETLRNLSEAEHEVNSWINHLEQNELIEPENINLLESYNFSNAMVQEVAYENLLLQTRYDLHLRVGMFIENNIINNLSDKEDDSKLTELLEQESELLAYHFGKSNDYDKASKYLEMSGEKARNAYALNTAISHFELLYDIKVKQKDKVGQADTLYLLGVMAYEMGNYEQGETWLNDAISLYKSLKDESNQSWGVMYLGMIALKQGNYGLSKKYHQKALTSAQTRKDEFQEGIHLTNLARVNMRLGKYKTAHELFDKSMALKTKLNDQKGQGFVDYFKSLIFMYQGKHDIAKKLLTDSLTEWRDIIQDKRGESYTLHGLGLLHFNQGDFDTAEKYFNDSLDINTELVLNAEVIENLSFLALTISKIGKSDLALETSLLVIEKLNSQKDVEDIQQIYYNHYLILKEHGSEHADSFLEKAFQVVKKQSNDIKNKKDREVFENKVSTNKQIIKSQN